MDAEEKMELKVYNKMTIAEGRKFLIRSLPERSDCTSVVTISVTSAMLASPSPWTFSTETLLDECTLPVSSEFSQLDSSSEALYYVYQVQCLLEIYLDDALFPYPEAMAEEDGGKAQQTAEAKDIINKLKKRTIYILTGAYQDALKFINTSIGKLNVFCFTPAPLLFFATSPFIPNLSVFLQKLRKRRRNSECPSLVRLRK
ncbi:hypothetical protein IGI04_029786 [Brassica rapa subsp. trilocularis]|uniref:Uncharacterized protein n=1 Tax=Brassica rapa subsp. trilocularis TaxID=1813537 RepID=A0ABQ7LNT1_BRACM|nr:hypothetical protein IGI04_029786 [Brassica rapa subsp. trilocularis]